MSKRRTTSFLMMLVLCSTPLSYNYAASADTDSKKENPKSSFLPAAISDLTGGILLGRPTNDSITLNVLASKGFEAYFEYGTEKGNYTEKTDAVVSRDGEPIETVIDNLQSNTQYYYRMQYRKPGETKFSPGEEHSFHTQRIEGETFTFAVQADPHMDGHSSEAVYERTLDNMLGADPDFLIDLGDSFMCEKFAENYTDVLDRYYAERTYYGIVGSSVPLFLANGNHEGEQGWMLDGSPNNIPVWATEARKLFYLNPYPDDFYSGSTREEPIVGVRESYYAWEWSDALFVVLDPYWYTTTKVDQSGNPWLWTLGKEQYDWFKNVLESSKARYKFVFIHHILGTNRGMTRWANLYEWGGLDKAGVYEFDTKRPGWDKPIHQLMVENKVTIFFQGHDHLFVKEELDGVVYQEVPQPSLKGPQDPAIADEYGYTGYVLPSSGYVRITVSSSNVKVDYIRTYLSSEEVGGHKNGEVAYSYTISEKPTATVIMILAIYFVFISLYLRLINSKTTLTTSISTSPPAIE